MIMAEFEFRLQSFLSLKEKLEDQRRLEYGRAMAALERERKKEAVLIKEKEDTIDEFTKMVQTKIEPEKFTMLNIYIEIVKEKLVEQKKVVAEAERFAEEKRIVLVEAMREKETLQRLKEKDYEEFLVEEKRLEQRAVDEIVSYKYANEASLE